MWDFVDALYRYTQENQITKYLQTREYRQAAHGLEEDWEGFYSTLTKAQIQKLDMLLAKERTVEKLENKASLLAGISIGLNLGRL